MAEKVKVFISWSGELSRKLAEAIRKWLPATLQFVAPYFTPSDIEKGTRWESEISSELGGSEVGIICVTRDSLGSPWISFEAGALSKNLDRSRVCPLLFDVEPTDVKGPLAVFQHTRYMKDDYRRLLETVNAASGDFKLDKSVLDEVFEERWPKLKETVDRILADHTFSVEDPVRPVDEMVKEILELTRYHVHQEESRLSSNWLSFRKLVDESGNIWTYDSSEKTLKRIPPVPDTSRHSSSGTSTSSASGSPQPEPSPSGSAESSEVDLACPRENVPVRVRGYPIE
jgi:hypothetical protein